MNRDPLTRQRSSWTRHSDLYSDRRVGDGTLRAIVVEEPLGWHMSISFVNHRGEPSRYPTWDEIAHARDELLPEDIGFVMHLPCSDEYVAFHATTFHLHEFPERSNP